MYKKIKNDIAQEYYVKNYPNDGQRFVAWYLRNIHNLDTFEAKACITDGAGDKQIDAVYIDDQSSTIYIIQGKVSVKCGYEKTSQAWLVFQNQIFIYVERQRSGACAGNKAVAQSSPLDASIGALVRTHVR